MQILKDENAKWSSTRIALLVALLVYLSAFVGETFLSLDVSEEVWGVMKILLGATVGATAIRGAADSIAKR